MSLTIGVDKIKVNRASCLELIVSGQLKLNEGTIAIRNDGEDRLMDTPVKRDGEDRQMEFNGRGPPKKVTSTVKREYEVSVN